VISGHHLFRFDPSGLPEPGFEAPGGLELVSTLPGLDFEPEELLPDGEGPIVVAGTTEESTEAMPLLQTWPTVMRYQTNGALDPSFAQNGVFLSDFGFPPPKPVAESQGISPAAPSAYERPQVYFRGFESSGEGTLILQASAVTETGGCAGGRAIPSSQSFEARLKPDGSLDPALAPGGFRPTSTPGLNATLAPLCPDLPKNPGARSPHRNAPSRPGDCN
jgi:hypothetical protein